MALRVRVRVAPPLAKGTFNRELASVTAAILTPAAVMAFVLGCWRLGSDLKWTGEFAISQGLFSHWQVWFGMAGILQTCASVLNRFGRGGGEAMPS